MRNTRKQRKTKIPSPGPRQCHPSVGFHRPAYGCLPPVILNTIAKKSGVSVKGKLPEEIRRDLEHKLQVSEGKEHSFLAAAPLTPNERSQYEKQYLRPQMPDNWKKDPDQWLDSTNIERVMKQYEEMDPKFEFMGPFPIDFAAPDPYKGGGSKCLIQEMCSMRITESLKKGIQKIGIIYNLDPHYKGGSHWIANFIDIPAHQCYYFDSYGMKPPKQIETFMKWLTTQDSSLRLAFNARRFQFNGSECGMYCLYFIIQMLAGDNFKKFCRRAPRDSAMLDLRDWLFST